MIYGKDQLWIKRTTEGTIAENGDYTPGAETWVGPIQCDAKDNGQAHTRTFADGEAKTYSYEIFVDLADGPFKFGDQVRVVKDGDNASEHVYQVLGYHRYTAFAKLWV